jgi:hypothetical protein
MLGVGDARCGTNELRQWTLCVLFVGATIGLLAMSTS